MTELVLRRDAEGVRTLTLNRPDRRNALNVALLEALRAEIAAAAADPDARCLILTGAGPAFCAGADVDEWSQATAGGDGAGLRWEENAHGLMQELHDLARPTVALLNGSAVGAGLDLACCCDFRMAGASARVACAYTWIGYSPDAGGTWLYPRLMGIEAAKRFVYTGERWDAATALRHGLVGEVVPDEELAGAGHALAARLAAGPTVALGCAKRLMQSAQRRTFADQLVRGARGRPRCARHGRPPRGAARRRRTPRPVFPGR